MLTIQDLLSALAQRLESGPLYLSQDNLCAVRVDDSELNVEWLEEEETVFVYLPIGGLPENQSNSILLELMEANLFFQGTTDQAVFGFDSEQQKVFLCQHFALAHTEKAHFVAACVGMIELTKVWQQKLSTQVGRSQSVTSLSHFSGLK